MRYEPDAPHPAEPAAPLAAPQSDGETSTPRRPRAVGPTPPGGSAGALGDERAAAHRAVHGVLRLALEVLDRRRPLAQLTTHFAAAPLRCWRVAVEQRRPRSPAHLRGLRLCLPCPGVAEAAATCAIDGRVRAVAARFERSERGWRCTAIRLG